MLAILAAVAMFQDIKKLDFLIGDWTSVEQTTGPDGKPAEIRLTGHNEWALAKRFLQIDEQFTVGGAGDYRNHILMSYDARKKQFRAWWFTNSSPAPIEFAGEFSDDKLTLTSSSKLRIVYHDIKPTSYLAELEQEVDGKWTKRTEAKYTRK